MPNTSGASLSAAPYQDRLAGLRYEAQAIPGYSLTSYIYSPLALYARFYTPRPDADYSHLAEAKRGVVGSRQSRGSMGRMRRDFYLWWPAWDVRYRKVFYFVLTHGRNPAGWNLDLVKRSGDADRLAYAQQKIWEKSHAQLRAFFERIRRAGHVEALAFWSLENQTLRGVPHYNVMFSCDCPESRDCGAEIAAMWLDITGLEFSPRSARMKYGVYGERVLSIDGVVNYISTELNKASQKRAPQGVQPVGLWYGKRMLSGDFDPADYVEPFQEIQLPGRLESVMRSRARDLCLAFGYNVFRKWWTGDELKYVETGDSDALFALWRRAERPRAFAIWRERLLFQAGRRMASVSDEGGGEDEIKQARRDAWLDSWAAQARLGGLSYLPPRPDDWATWPEFQPEEG